MVPPDPTKTKSKKKLDRSTSKMKTKSRSRVKKSLEGGAGDDEGLTPAQTKQKRERAKSKAAGSRSWNKKTRKPSAEMSPGAGSDKVTLKARTKSLKYIGLEPEWNSETIRNEKLNSDGFTTCVVLVMEESSFLTPYTQFLHRAVGSGIRRNFVSISGQAISQKVQKFMTSAGLREANQEDMSYLDRIDIWAEAIKHVLLQFKARVLAEHHVQANAKAKKEEITGVRSKELVKVIKPVVEVESSASLVGSSSKTHPAVKSSRARDDVRKAKLSIKLKSGSDKKKKGEKKKEETKGKREKGDKKAEKEEKGGKTEKRRRDETGVQKTVDADFATPKDSNSKPTTLLRKRGEFIAPFTEFIDDSPPDGPQRYFFLQGFYNPDLMEQLQAVGVKIDCVLLITITAAGIISKHNSFSMLDIDIDQNMNIGGAGTFRPQILPEYAKAMGESHKDRDARNQVNHFWVRLAKMITADAGSPTHDVALMDCSLPPGNLPETVEQQGDFASKLFDKAAHLVYEMLALKDRYKYNEYFGTSTKKFGLSTALYDRLLNEIPPECITVPIILECLIEQVVENEKIENASESCYSKDEREGKDTIQGRGFMASEDGGSPTVDLWERDHHESITRIRQLATEQQLRTARPDALRWFAYILTTAHTRRTKFVLTPRQAYEKQKRENPRPLPPPPTQPNTTSSPEEVPQPENENQGQNLNPQESEVERQRTMDTSVKESSETTTGKGHDQDLQQQQQQLHQKRKDKRKRVKGDGRRGLKQSVGEREAKAEAVVKPDKHKEMAESANAQRRLKRRPSIKKTASLEREGRSKSIAPSTADVGEVLQTGGGRKAKPHAEIKAEEADAGDGGVAAAETATDASATEPIPKPEEEQPANQSSVNLEVVKIPDNPSEPPTDPLGLDGVDAVDKAETRPTTKNAQRQRDPKRRGREKKQKREQEQKQIKQ